MLVTFRNTASHVVKTAFDFTFLYSRFIIPERKHIGDWDSAITRGEEDINCLRVWLD